VRIDTSLRPGNELAAVTYLQERLEPFHAETHLFEPAPQRRNLTARLAGSGEAKPLLMLGQLDVVPTNCQD
jgi:acetylornithine deacetylase/succinyl-diaminopimelate desuccinylase-like protein